MAGVLQIHEMTGTNTGTDKTSGTVRFKAADNVTVDDADRLQIGGATTYSYIKQLRAYASSAPDTDFTNLEAYTDGGTFSNSVTCMYDVTWTNSVGSFTANVTNSIIGGVDLFTKVTGARIDMNSWDAAWTAGEASVSSYYGSTLRLQLAVGSDANPGTLVAETLTFSYDET